MSTTIDSIDYQRYAILFVDDEANTRKYFRRLFGEKFRILEAGDGAEALDVFRQHADDIGIIVTDQRMPGETGVEFLSKIADEYPDIIKILSTAYSDIDAAIGSVNKGGIFRYMTKPWDIPQMEVTLRRAMEFFIVKRERDLLLAANMEAVEKVLLASRLVTFALAPVCMAVPCARAAEAVASLVRVGVSGHVSVPVVGPHDWSGMHASQILFAKELGEQLTTALAQEDFTARTATLVSELKSAGATGLSSEDAGASIRISCDVDPTPDLMDCLLGGNQKPAMIHKAVNVLAAYMAVYDAGGTIRRIDGEGLSLEVIHSAQAEKGASPGEEAVKWLMGDDQLVSTVLGLSK